MNSADEKQELSTRLSALYRWGIPGLLTVIAVTAIGWASISNTEAGIGMRILIAVVVAGTSVVYARWLDRAKRVWIDTEFLYVSDFSREAQIPLTNIKKLQVVTLIRPTRISVWFEQPTIFGDKISFFPRRGARDVLPDHPAVAGATAG